MYPHIHHPRTRPNVEATWSRTLQPVGVAQVDTAEPGRIGADPPSANDELIGDFDGILAQPINEKL